MDDDPVPLYVRLAADQARRLDQAANVSGVSKRRLIEDAVREHLTEDGLVVGRVALREESSEVLTVEEAAALLRIDAHTLLGAAERGELPGRQIGEHWRFARAALLDWLARAATGRVVGG
ncbi:MAG: helix-turn-helix domain-containing protein [Solirubrobacteraceae bacterium]